MVSGRPVFPRSVGDIGKRFIVKTDSYLAYFRGGVGKSVFVCGLLKTLGFIYLFAYHYYCYLHVTRTIGDGFSDQLRWPFS